MNSGRNDDWKARYAELAHQHQQLERRHLKTLQIADKYQADYRDVSEKLVEATASLRKLQELILPVCMHCKSIRAQDESWRKIDQYFFEAADLVFTHGVCPTCMESRYSALLQPTPIPQPRVDSDALQKDATTEKFDELLRDGPQGAETWRARLEELLVAYRRLLRRFTRVTLISDGYERELRDAALRLEHAARTDRLTGLSTRDAMAHRLQTELGRSRRDTAFDVILIRAQGLRRINEQAGVALGNAVLCRLAGRLVAALPEKSECARWGAGEFMALVASGDATARRLSEVGARLAETAVSHAGKTWRLEIAIASAALIEGDGMDDVLRRLEASLVPA